MSFVRAGYRGGRMDYIPGFADGEFYSRNMYDFWIWMLNRASSYFERWGRERRDVYNAGDGVDAKDLWKDWMSLEQRNRFFFIISYRWAAEEAMEHCTPIDEQQQFGIGDVGNFLLNLLFSKKEAEV